MFNVAESLFSVGRLSEAVKPLTTANNRSADVLQLGRHHSDTWQRSATWRSVTRLRGAKANRCKVAGRSLPSGRTILFQHPETLVSQSYLAESYRVLGRFDEAVRLADESSALLKAKLGPDHPQTLLSAAILARCESAAGRNSESGKLDEGTLALQKSKLGNDHPDALRTMNDLVCEAYAAHRPSGRRTGG